MELQDHDGETYVGSDLEIKVKVINQSDEERTLSGTVTVAGVHTTGLEYKVVKEQAVTETLKPKEGFKFI